MRFLNPSANALEATVCHPLPPSYILTQHEREKEQTRPAHSKFLNDLANDTPLPMIVDAECGMPLDLGKWGCLWEEDGDDPELNPNPANAPKLDPKDHFLLLDPSSIAAPYTPAGGASGTSTPTPMPHVTWLRKTEYITREGVTRSTAISDSKHTPLAPIDVSRSAQIRDIESSFAAVEEFDLAELRHPNKPRVTAVESYDILPDADIWANAYDLFRFSERPGDRPPDAEDPRLDCAILRPMESDGDHFLAYYLTKEDEAALQFKEERAARDPNSTEEGEPTNFHFIRDYEVVKVEQEVPNEFLLVISDEDVQDEFGDVQASSRAKGAYYKNIERKMLLKKRRVNSYQAYVDKWDVVKVSHVPMSKEEEDEREEALAEVMDPMYLLNRADMDAEGEEVEEETEVERPGGDIVDPIDVFGE
ncbi:hypothetical protein EUX98_g5361 [Antrodiella citrinella]|uniref:RNA polymerase II-associated protein n=1 Tax=Antrodiella citrinella TaxID=2447956 RepID=A0A4S4MZI2_9APHY|nr:hypothetical protein EUX98_g5361 [Antrodiella citrinella]